MGYVRAYTERAIETLEQGGVPTFPTRQVPEDAPTPIYNALAFAYAAVPLTAASTEARNDGIGRRLASVPIPSRPLSYQARARRTDPATSHQAAASVIKISETHERILALLRHGPGTDEHLLAEWTLRDKRWPPITPSGLRSRRSELVRAGKVVDSGERGTTAAGRRCIVWRLADQ